MILFRRAGEAFRKIEDREWLLLALETIGVLAGILIAFELQEWAQRRDDAARHQQLMERLFEETESDISSIRFMRDVLQPMVDREMLFATRLGRGECPADEDFRAVDTLPVMPALTAPTSVYQELMGAGGLSSIDRKDVRQHLAQFHDTLDWTQKQIDYFRASRRIPVEPDDTRLRTHFDPKAEDPEISVYDGRSLCRDQAFQNRVAQATRAHMKFVGYFDEAVKDAISVCVRLGDSLGRTCTPAYDGPLTRDDAKVAAKAHANMLKERAKA